MLAPLVWLIAIPLVHGVVPWAISSFTRRYGWSAGQPAILNLTGLIPVAAGAALLVWVFISGYRHTDEIPEKVDLNWSPKLLYVRGPYAFTRNPMYLAEVALWIGWTIFFGSFAVLIGCVVMCFGVSLVVRREERDLEAQFGEAYQQYKAGVPRWFGMVRH